MQGTLLEKPQRYESQEAASEGLVLFQSENVIRISRHRSPCHQIARMADLCHATHHTGTIPASGHPYFQAHKAVRTAHQQCAGGAKCTMLHHQTENGHVSKVPRPQRSPETITHNERSWPEMGCAPRRRGQATGAGPDLSTCDYTIRFAPPYQQNTCVSGGWIFKRGSSDHARTGSDVRAGCPGMHRHQQSSVWAMTMHIGQASRPR